MASKSKQLVMNYVKKKGTNLQSRQWTCLGIDKDRAASIQARGNAAGADLAQGMGTTKDVQARK